MFLNNIRFFIRDTISVWDVVWTAYRVSNDFEQDQIIDTGWETVSITLKNETQIERFEGTFSAGNVTFTRRGIDQSSTITTDVNLQKQWIEGSIGVITAFSSDLYDAQESLTIADGQQVEFWTDATTIRKNGTDLSFKDANNAERTLTELSQSWSNDQVRVTNNDTTPSVLNTKIVDWNGISKTVWSPSGNETLNISLDVDTTNGLTLGTQLGINAANESQLWAAQRASNTEFLAGTENTKFVTSAQTSFRIIPWDAVLAEDNTLTAASSWTYTKIKEIEVDTAWEYRVDFNLETPAINAWVQWRIYVNDIAVWVERSLTAPSQQEAYTENFTVSSWDLIQVFIRMSGWDNGSNRNFGVFFNTVNTLPTWTVNSV